MKTTIPKASETSRRWVVLDADGKPLGRLAVRIADILRGKDRPDFTPYVDTGDFVVVVNAEKVLLTGRKEQNKIYRRYSGHRSGLKETPASVMRVRHPDWMIKLAVRGMLPKNNLSRQMFKRLKVYAGAEHPHASQKPEKLELS